MNSDSSIIDVVLEVVTALLPLIVFFLIFQTAYLRFPRHMLRRVLTGLLLTGAGMILFLSGVFMGLMPISADIGMHLMENSDPWVIITFGFILGFLATLAEPAVRVLTYQVENSSSGFIQSRLLLPVLSLGVGCFVALGMARVVFDLDFHLMIVTAYSVALVLMVFCDRDFVSVAFDAGGVATGPMAVSLLMAMVVGMAEADPDANAAIDGFGLIALIALAPIIFISGLGVIVRLKNRAEKVNA